MSVIRILDQIINNPKYHDILAILKGTKNGIIYGARLRFCHALVMSVLFRSGPWEKRLLGVIRATRQHATVLGKFVFVYKSVLYLLKQGRIRLHGPQPANLTTIKNHNNSIDSFIAGVIGGYLVFGRDHPSAAGNQIAHQIVLYVFSRAVLGLFSEFAKQTYQVKEQRVLMSKKTYAVFASLSWGIVMYLFRLDPKVLQKSMLHSMDFLYIDSESWSGFTDFLGLN
jgi:peroxisomal membrane protein 4